MFCYWIKELDQWIFFTRGVFLFLLYLLTYNLLCVNIVFETKKWQLSSCKKIPLIWFLYLLQNTNLLVFTLSHWTPCKKLLWNIWDLIFETPKIVQSFVQVTTINYGRTATIWSGWGVQHPIRILCNFFELPCRLKVSQCTKINMYRI